MCWVWDLGLMCREMSKANFKSLCDDHCRHEERKRFAAWSFSLFCAISNVLVTYLVWLEKELAELFVSVVIWPAEKQIAGDPGSNADPEFFWMLWNFSWPLSSVYISKERESSPPLLSCTVKRGDFPRFWTVCKFAAFGALLDQQTEGPPGHAETPAYPCYRQLSVLCKGGGNTKCSHQNGVALCWAWLLCCVHKGAGSWWGHREASGAWYECTDPSVISQKQQLYLKNKSLKQRLNSAGVMQGYRIEYLQLCISKPGESFCCSCGWALTL